MRCSELFDKAQGVVPQCVDLYRLAVAWCHDPIANLGIHPRELRRGVAGPQESVCWVHSYVVVGSSGVAFDRLQQYRQHLTIHEFSVTGVF